ncbi:ribonuclease P protein component [Naasia aerilata]|uniref:Ribonuclease P protein component n=1 Tax=Naasia aerilata TaxID=1162966 RepID=A0ABN6XKG9_9MICO|nr:ribonuclease P protein component [Naasia aerilata]BDZ45374.1 ribonuclease P protein component [Naasia aerilata]
MLARAHRVVSGADYRRIVRKGRRVNGRTTIAYLDRVVPGDDARFGFIVSRAVGGAVERNRVRRRLKAVCFSLLPEAPSRAVVLRALPAAACADWDELRAEVAAAVLRPR